MKNLILIAILIAGWKYGVTALKNLEPTHSSATSIERTINDKVEDYTSQVKANVKDIANSFSNKTATPVETAKAQMSNTVTEICVPKDCSGMDCYKDLEKPLTVVAASNI